MSQQDAQNTLPKRKSWLEPRNVAARVAREAAAHAAREACNAAIAAEHAAAVRAEHAPVVAILAKRLGLPITHIVKKGRCNSTYEIYMGNRLFGTHAVVVLKNYKKFMSRTAWEQLAFEYSGVQLVMRQRGEKCSWDNICILLRLSCVSED